tara:strand:- start:862 stop:993 length:132 start_codon:yes stop_codon:yes gene_type:complete
MKKEILIKAGIFTLVFLAVVGAFQLAIGFYEFLTGTNPICQCK